jgi:hypothetical protein
MSGNERRPRHQRGAPRPQFKKTGKSGKKTEQSGGKRYRHTFRLRPCVLPMLFLIPVVILGVERYLGALFDFEDIQRLYAYTEQDLRDGRTSSPPPIINITHTPVAHCGQGLLRIFDVNNPKSHSLDSRKIPQIVHQTSNTRCLARNFYKAAFKWRIGRWSYYMHDDDAVDRFLQLDFPEFPHLKVIANDCLTSKTAKTFLWRYLVLWAYGGVFVDLNLIPLELNAKMIEPVDDGVFVIDEKSGSVSPHFMAVSPKHPIMYYAVQRTLLNLLRAEDLGSISSVETIGALALQEALNEFQKDSGKKATGIHAGTVHGTSKHRTIRIAGELKGPDGLFESIFQTEAGMIQEYEKMGRIHENNKQKWSGLCFRSMLKQTSAASKLVYTEKR